MVSFMCLYIRDVKDGKTGKFCEELSGRWNVNANWILGEYRTSLDIGRARGEVRATRRGPSVSDGMDRLAQLVRAWC